MSLSGINFSGISSGIDTESIISQLVKLQQQPIVKMQQQQQTIQQQQAAVNQISALISGVQAAAGALDSTTGFTQVTSSNSDDTVATVSASSGAQTGSHSLQVVQLAASQKIGSIELDSKTDGLGVDGQIVINGKAIKVSSTDSLQTLVSNINGAQAGVSASIISPEDGKYRVVLSSANSGNSGAISLSDVAGGTILQSKLGLIGATASIAHPITGGAAANLFKDSATSIGTLIGMASPPSGTISIKGVPLAEVIDLGTDSLSTIVAKINNSSIPGVTAGIITTTDPISKESRQQLQISGASAASDFTESNNVLATLGIIKYAPVDEVAAAKDAKFKLDGIDITRSTNTVTDVLSGVTIQLAKDKDSPTTNFTVQTDILGIKSAIGGLVSGFNQLVSTYGNLASFDPDTLKGGILFGDVTVQNVVNQITDALTSPVKGLKGDYTALAQVGITLDKTGQLSVNDAELTAALNKDLGAVTRLFKAAAVPTDSSVAFISATQETKASPAAGYRVNISQVAAQAVLTTSTAHTADDNPDSEVLTFSGAAFGTATRTLVLTAFNTLDGIISQINADTTLSAVLTATRVNNNLALTAKQYGSGASFVVSSSQAAAANNSGIGNTALTASGIDVIGTINGEAATGKGQVLTGNKGNANTDGLILRVSSLIPGDHGFISFAQGVAAQLKYIGDDLSDTIDGTLTKYTGSLGDQITDLTAQIKDSQDRIKSFQQNLRLQFAAMEGAVTSLKSSQNSLAALTQLGK
jgi:flagellar hook-associated protein 2